MDISKFELVALLFDHTNGSEIASKKIAQAYKHKNLIWSQDEWIYVKDVEAALKAMKKLFDKGDFEQFPQIKEMVLGTAPVPEINDSWLKSRILDCQSNLEALYSRTTVYHLT